MNLFSVKSINKRLLNIVSLVAGFILFFVSVSSPAIFADDVYGCTDPAASNYNPEATVDDGSCQYNNGDVYGCTDFSANNYNPEATIDDSTCMYDGGGDVYGCTDPAANNYNSLANMDDGSCDYGGGEVYGCTDSMANNYNSSANIDDGSCTYGGSGGDISGCTDQNANNYNSSATADDGSCTYDGNGGGDIGGCTDQNASNYDSNANIDNGTCIFPGCTNPSAYNYSSTANQDDNSCAFIPQLISITSTSSSGTYTAGDVISLSANFDLTILEGSYIAITLNSGINNNDVEVLLNTVVGTSTLYGEYVVGVDDYTESLNALGVHYVSIIDVNNNIFTSVYNIPTSPNNIRDSVAIRVLQDLTSPVLSDISETIGTSTATIYFTTNEFSTSTINYGTSSEYGSTTVHEYALEYIFNLINLIPGTTYHYNLVSVDMYGNTSTTSDLTFTTLSIDNENTEPVASTSTPVVSTVQWVGPISGGGSSSSGGFSSNVVGNTYNYFNNFISNNISNNIIKIIKSNIPSVSYIKNIVNNKDTFKTPAGDPFVFNKNIHNTSKKMSDIKKLQILLNALGFTVSEKGPGSPGNETDVFGPLTRSALIKFQKENNIKTVPGFFGPLTQDYLNALLDNVLSEK